MNDSIKHNSANRFWLTLAIAITASSSLVGVAYGQQKDEVPQDYRKDAISPEFPYESNYVEILGSKMHYIDQGDGDIFLFLHGNPTSSYLWRNVMRYVAPHGRIVAVDNIGFGKSDKPKIDYTFQTHARYTEEFIDTLGLKNVILVVHDWGSALGLDYAASHTNNVKGVVFMEAIRPIGCQRTTGISKLSLSATVATLFKRTIPKRLDAESSIGIADSLNPPQQR